MTVSSFNFSTPVKKPGYYQLRVALLDEASQHIGSANQFIEVPDVSKALTLSSLILEKEADSSDRTAGETGEGQVPELDPKGNPALRIFKQGDAGVRLSASECRHWFRQARGS
jgi:hypothetical protein